MHWLQLTRIVWQNRRKTVFFKDVVDCLVLGGWREIRGLIESIQALLNTVRDARELPASACYNGQIYVFIATAVILYLPSSLIPVLNGRERPFLMK